MSLDVLTAIWRDPPCKAGDLLCLLAIADNADEHGHAWPSVATIARKAAMSERGARKCLRKLEENGLIQVEIGGGRGGASSYQITTNGIGSHHNHKNPERYSGNTVPGNQSETGNIVPPIEGENPEQSDINPEQSDRKPGTPVPPNRQEPSENRQYCSDEQDFEIFFGLAPRGGDEDEAYQLFIAAIQAGEDPKRIIAAIENYAAEQDGNGARYKRYAENFLRDGFWRRYAPSASEGRATATSDALAIREWDASKNGPMQFSASLAERLVAEKLISQQDCERAGIKI